MLVLVILIWIPRYELVQQHINYARELQAEKVAAEIPFHHIMEIVVYQYSKIVEHYHVVHMLVIVECLKIQSPLAKTKQLLFHTLFFLFFSFILFCNICRLSQSNCHVTENYICKRNNLEYHALCNYTSDTPVYLCSMEKHSYHFLQMIQSTMHNFLLHIISDTAGLG